MAHIEIVVSLISFVALLASWFVLPSETRTTLSLAAERTASAA